MWLRVAQWTIGFLKTTDKRIEAYREFSPEEEKEVIHQIAAINVKKVNGKSNSKDEDLRKYLSDNEALLRREIESAAPRIIVCGSTFDYLNELFGSRINKKEQPCDNWHYRMDLGKAKDVLVIDAYHPSAHYPALLSYYGIVNIYQQALLAQRKPAETALPFSE